MGCAGQTPLQDANTHFPLSGVWLTTSRSGTAPSQELLCHPRSHLAYGSYPSLGTVEIPLFFQRGGKGPGTLPSFTRLCGVSAPWGLLAETSAAWAQHLPQPIPASSLPPIHYS